MYHLNLNNLETSTEQNTVFGRILTIRSHGRSTFVDLWRNGHRLQLVASTQDYIDRLHVGSWVEATGQIRPTQRCEMSLWVDNLRIISQSTSPLEQQHESGRLMQEQRYVVNPEQLLHARRRSQITQSIRQFLWSEQFEEVTTPILCRNASGAAARPFETHSRALDQSMFLRVAPESQLIRLMMAGFDSIFELGACFRNEGVSERHQPQFELLECYRGNETINQTMDRVERLLVHTLETNGVDSSSVTWGEHTMNWQSIRRATLEELVAEYTNCHSASDCLAYLASAGIEWHDGNDELLSYCMVFEHFIEEQLVQPTFVTRWPVCVSTLARHTDNGFTARFELYASGMELANGYEQEMDINEQERRFEQQASLLGQEDVMASDEEYLFAMGWGMPQLSGFGLGIDRWVQVVTNSSHIRDVVLFPF